MKKRTSEKTLELPKKQKYVSRVLKSVYFYFFSGITLLGSYSIFNGNKLNQSIAGEEGMFAFMLTNSVVPSKSLLIGSLGGTLQFTAPEHPILIYNYMASLRPIVASVVQLLGENPIAYRLWNVMPILFLAVLGAIWIRSSSTSKQRTYFATIVLALLVSLPIFGTPLLTIQTDTVFGSVLFLSGGLILVGVALNNSEGRRQKIAIFASGTVFALGKQEWVFSAVIACGLLVVIELFNFNHNSYKEKLKIRLGRLGFLIVFSGGLLAGSMASFLADPRNFMGGLDVIRRTMFSSDVSTLEKILKASYFMTQKTPYVIPLFALLILNAVFAMKFIQDINKRNLFLFANLLAIANIIPGYVSSWSGDLRYVVPGAVLTVLLTLSALIIFANRTTYLTYSGMIVGISIIVTAHNPSFVYQDFRTGIHQIENSANADCAALTSSAEAFLNPERVNWISQDLGEAGALAHLKLHGGKITKICTE